MILEQLQSLKADLVSLKVEINRELGPRISKKGIRQRTEALATHWFTDISPVLKKESIVGLEILQAYEASFNKLLKLSNPNNLQDRYLDVLTSLLKNFRTDLILPIQTAPKRDNEISALESILTGFSSMEED